MTTKWNLCPCIKSYSERPKSLWRSHWRRTEANTIAIVTPFSSAEIEVSATTEDVTSETMAIESRTVECSFIFLTLPFTHFHASPIALKYTSGMLFKLIAATLALALQVCDTALAAESDPLGSLPLKVMTFNLRTTLANDPCPAGCWEQRKHRIQQMLSNYVPDFIGTQEGAPDQIEFLENDLQYGSVGECAGDCQWNERNSIFYVQDRWQLLENTTFALSDTPEQIPSNTWNLEYLRAAVLARFQLKQVGSESVTICMLNTHFDITRGHEQSALLVTQRLAQFCRPRDVVFMTGDLNAPPTESAVQYLIGEAALNGSSTPIPLYETFLASNIAGPTWIGSSFGNETYGSKLDYILTRRGDTRTALRSAHVIVDTFDGFSCSDHAVLQSEFRIGDASAVVDVSSEH
ncbi:Angel protein, partial [Globisporangium splendens]